MPLPAPLVFSRLPVPPPPPIGTGKREPEIIVIPEKFYAMALKMKPPFAMEEKPPEPVPKPVLPLGAPMPVLEKPQIPTVLVEKKAPWGIVVLVLVLVFLVIGGFFVFNWNRLFVKTPAPTPAPVLLEIPPTPTNVQAEAPVPGNVALRWRDISALETGYRVERREESGTFMPVTDLPVNSTSFLDTSVQEGRTYHYRLVAVNQSGASGPSDEVEIAIPVSPPPAPPAPSLPPGGLDTDSDGLSDLEEGLFETDAHKPDTDGDSFLDGNEVFHLYNPQGGVSVTLLESGVVKLVTSTVGWMMSVPSSWITAFDVSKVTIDTGHGERFFIHLEDNPERLPMMDWYASTHPSVARDQIWDIRTKRGLNGVVGPDRLELFFAWDSKVISVKYDLNGQAFVNFRTTFEMMLNSLELRGLPQVVPEQQEALLSPGAFMGSLASSTTSTITPSKP